MGSGTPVAQHGISTAASHAALSHSDRTSDGYRTCCTGSHQALCLGVWLYCRTGIWSTYFEKQKGIQHLGIKFSCIFTVCCQIWLPWLLGWFSSVQ